MYRKLLVVLIIVLSFAGMTLAQNAAIPVPLPDNGDICWDKTETQDVADIISQEGFDEFIAELEKDSGFYSALFRESDNITFIGGRTYRVPIQEASTFTYSVYSPEDTPDVRFWAFHNEQQLLIGDEQQPYLDVDIASKEKFNLTLELPPLAEGVHDIVVMYHDDLKESPLPVGSLGSATRRFTVIVGDPAIPTNALTYETLPESGSLAADDPLQFGFTLGDDLLQWSYPDETHTLSTGATLSFDILTGFFGANVVDGTQRYQPTVARFALTLLMDYEQIPFTEDGNEVLYGEVSSDTAYTRLPVTLPAFEEPGYHELAMVQINNPRVPMCILNGGQAYSLNSDVNFIRVGIDVVAD